MQDYPVKLLKINQETPTVRVFQVENPGVDFAPGQFFMVSVPDDPNVTVTRAYSVASSPLQKEHIEIGFNKVGVLTTKFFEMKEGDLLNFKGPFGKFFFDDTVEKDILLIGAGTGITPLMSILRHCTIKETDHRLRLVYSVKRPDEVVYATELDERKQENGHFDYAVTVTRPEEGDSWDGRTGRVDKEMLAEQITDAAKTEVYICGAKEFVFGMIDLLGELGVTKEQIKTDVWG